jgi:hypothetical protein
LLQSTCANCDAPLSGPYCSQCGQHIHDSARTLGALLHDGWHVLTHLDGRFWGTMGLLLLRPGRLTVEYFAARRARYVPPVRLYLVLSIVVFALASATSHDGARPRAAGATPAAKTVDADADADADQDTVDSLVGSPAGPTTGKVAGKAQAPRADGDFNLAMLGLSTKNCGKLTSNWAWVTNALRAGCERNAGRSAAEAMHTLRANLPRMMFVFLPLMALVMSLLYWFPRRYYVEHLVFFLHNHAALYLAMSLEILVGMLATLVPALDPLVGVGAAILCLYTPWYVYRSMRTFYGQGRVLTLLKICVVSLAYLVFLMVTLVLTAVYSVLLS